MKTDKRWRIIVLVLGLLLLAAGCSETPLQPESEVTGMHQTVQTASVSMVPAVAFEDQDWTEHGAEYLIQVPENWNGSLVVYAHGYVSTFQERGLISVEPVMKDVFLGMGYAYGVTSYRTNGLVPPSQGIEDLFDVIDIFEENYESPEQVLLFGISEGGMLATLATEQSPDRITGTLATCAPIGDFRQQINYLGDFRVIFDYYFPGLLPKWTDESPAIPVGIQVNWLTDRSDASYFARITGALMANPEKFEKLLGVSGAVFDPNDPSSKMKTAIALLSYNIVALNDAIAKLGGLPYDNTSRWYSGTGSVREDRALNQAVERLEADAGALHTVREEYQTSGELEVPLVLIHTTMDELVPYWHERMYRLKALRNGSVRSHMLIPVERYAHCTFTGEELVNAFATLNAKIHDRRLRATPVTPPFTDFDKGGLQHLVHKFGMNMN